MKISKSQLRSIVREARAKAPDDMTDAKLDAELAKSIPKDFGPRGASTIRVEPPNEKLRAPYKTGSSWETGGDAAGRYFGEDHPISGFYHPLQRYAAATIGKKEKINQTGIRSYEVQPGGPGGQWVMTFVWRDRYGRRSSERSTPIKYSENIRDTGDWNIWAAKDGIGDAIIRHLVDLGEISPESLEKLEKYWSSPNADPSPHGKPRGARAWPEPAGGMAESAIRVSKRQLQRIIREERALISERMRAVDYAMNTYTPVEDVGQVENIMLRLWSEVSENALQDGMEDDESAEMASHVLLQILIDTLNSVGDTQFANELGRFLR